MTCCDERWEAAYLRFESAAEERRKFRRRLLRLGAGQWNRASRVVELCCGRGGALGAWEDLGFSHLEGVDLSERLLREYQGCAQRYVADIRELPFAPGSRDIVAVQGGLHHLVTLPDDLELTLASAQRCLVDGGLFVAVEPAMTPFLALVHNLSFQPLLRRLLPRLDAFATMVEQERTTYENWLARRAQVIELLQRHFVPLALQVAMGKLMFVGQKR